MSIKIVSLNCWCGQLPGIPEYLRKLDADVYCLQEVFSAPPGTPERVVFNYEALGGAEVRGNSRLFSALQEALPHHRGTFYPEMQNMQRGDGYGAYPLRFGTACFIRNTLAVMAERVEFVYGQYRPDGWGMPPLPRKGHCVRLWREDVQKPIVIAHTHGTWIPGVGKVDIPERLHQMYTFRDLIGEVRRRGDDIVVCGDFNVLPRSATFLILSELGLCDLGTSRGFTDTRTSHYKKEPRFADYMLVSPGVEVLSFDVPASPEVSDHRPLVLVCR